MAVLNTNLNTLFVTSDSAGLEHPFPDLTGKLIAILNDPALPSFTLPHERLFFIRKQLEDDWIASGHPDSQVRLRPSTQAALSSLARTSIYREEIGDRAYGELLYQSVGLNLWQIVAQEGYRRAVSGIVKFLNSFGSAPIPMRECR